MKGIATISLFSRETQKKYRETSSRFWNGNLTKAERRSIADEFRHVIQERAIYTVTPTFSFLGGKFKEYRVVQKVYWNKEGDLCYDYDSVIPGNGTYIPSRSTAQVYPGDRARVIPKSVIEANMMTQVANTWKRLGFACRHIDVK